MRTQIGDSVRQRSQRLADLQNEAAELQRKLSDARGQLERELGESGYDSALIPEQFDLAHPAGADPDELDFGSAFLNPDDAYALDPDADSQPDDDATHSSAPMPSAQARTEVLVTHGRGGRHYWNVSRRQLIVAGCAAGAALVTILVLVLSGGGAAWPSSVATITAESATACKNPDVASEPGQVNFACAQATRPILWVFALMTSGGNPDFGDAKSGRMGLEPITPAQGGEVAWSLNLHHPYSPANPVDSLEVAARAINNIIGGATVTGTSGKAVIQPGLESTAANCTRYTGSPALKMRHGFPAVCARPVDAPAGQAALVADVYQKWIVGAAPQAAQNAGVLFVNSNNPGDPQVQSILRSLRNAQPPA
ncbi:MAG TPA: hypothetical protein VFX25_20030 [Streptosporangiaceae bacterium]|nr:hypothetical protein [Streptosporangiaceae bacterium]